MPLTIGRRRFLTGAGAALAVAPFAAAHAEIAHLGARSLSFDNIHTGEKLSVDYWADGDIHPGRAAVGQSCASRLSQRRGSRHRAEATRSPDYPACASRHAGAIRSDLRLSLSRDQRDAARRKLTASLPKACTCRAWRSTSVSVVARCRRCTTRRCRCTQAVSATIPHRISCMSTSVACACGAAFKSPTFNCHGAQMQAMTARAFTIAAPARKRASDRSCPCRRSGSWRQAAHRRRLRAPPPAATRTRRYRRSPRP